MVYNFSFKFYKKNKKNNLKIIIKKLLGLINLIKVLTFYIYILIKVVIFYKYEILILIAFQIVLLNFKSFNNSKYFIIIIFIFKIN